MSIGSARRRFGAWPHRSRTGDYGRPSLAPDIAGAVKTAWACLEVLCILIGVTLGGVAVVRIVDALLDALHN